MLRLCTFLLAHGASVSRGSPSKLMAAPTTQGDRVDKKESFRNLRGDSFFCGSNAIV